MPIKIASLVSFRVEGTLFNEIHNIDHSTHIILFQLLIMDQHHYSNTTHVAQTEASSVQNECENFSIIPAIHRAVHVNNEGTKLVRQCQYDAAVKSFTAVLKILKPLAALVEASEDNEDMAIPSDDRIPMSISFSNTTTENTNTGSSTASEEQTPSSQEYWAGVRSPIPSNNKKQRRLSTNAAAKLLVASGPTNKFARRTTSHFVFRDPVQIPPESVPSSVSVDVNGGHSSELFSKFLMIVMYNLALTLHLHALSLSNVIRNQNPNLAFADSGESSDAKKAKKLFLRARKLYELAFEMHLDESCDVNLLFTLALINNLGLVYDVLDQKQRSKTCFKNMFSTMMYLMDSNESHTVKEWDGLLSNVMDILFQQHREIAAPAA